MPTIQTKHTRAPQTEIYYETYGEGQPLLLIHGNGGSIDSDRCQIAYFSRFRRVIPPRAWRSP